MTITELKEKKQALEEEIAEKIREFEKETELHVTRINYNARIFTYDGDDIIPQIKEEMYDVNIEVKL